MMSSELNEKAYSIIDKIALYCRNLSENFSELKEKFDKTQAKLAISEIALNEAHQKITQLETNLNAIQQENNDKIEIIKQQQKSLDDNKDYFSLQATLPTDIQPDQQQDVTEFELKILELEENVKLWEDKYKTTHRILQNEMVKMDTMQTEFELVQKERDIALRRQSMSPEQKQILIKLEHESYKINEAIERIDYISNSLKKIFALQDNYQERV